MWRKGKRPQGAAHAQPVSETIPSSKDIMVPSAKPPTNRYRSPPQGQEEEKKAPIMRHTKNLATQEPIDIKAMQKRF